jgi:hypothetical protein
MEDMEISYDRPTAAVPMCKTVLPARLVYRQCGHTVESVSFVHAAQSIMTRIALQEERLPDGSVTYRWTHSPGRSVPERAWDSPENKSSNSHDRIAMCYW